MKCHADWCSIPFKRGTCAQTENTAPRNTPFFLQVTIA